jgi:hypothetical protein
MFCSFWQSDLVSYPSKVDSLQKRAKDNEECAGERPTFNIDSASKRDLQRLGTTILSIYVLLRTASRSVVARCTLAVVKPLKVFFGDPLIGV